MSGCCRGRTRHSIARRSLSGKGKGGCKGEQRADAVRMQRGCRAGAGRVQRGCMGERAVRDTAAASVANSRRQYPLPVARAVGWCRERNAVGLSPVHRAVQQVAASGVRWCLLSSSTH